MRFYFVPVLMGFVYTLSAQNMGMSFSYFIPRNGSFSTPISPFSLRGIGFDLHRNIALETGFTLYRIAGLNVLNLPFKSNLPLTGPHFTIMIPAELIFRITGKKLQFEVKGGGFFFYAFDQRINYGNMDRAIRAYKGWGVTNSTFHFDNYPGLGYRFGLGLSYPIKSNFGISAECNYLVGQARFPLRGTYSGGTINGVNWTVDARFDNSMLDFTGLEFSIGVFLLGK